MKKKTYSKSIAEVISKFLTEDDWHYSFEEDEGVFEMSIGIDAKIKRLKMFIDVKEDEYIVYAISPIGPNANDKKMMALMLEFICRANYGLKNGSFEIDVSDGEIRYRTFVDCEGSIPNAEVVRNSIYWPAAMFDRYGDGIVGIIFNNMSAEEAIDMCENTTEDIVKDILEDVFDEEDDAKTMAARLAARLGIEADFDDYEDPDDYDDSDDFDDEEFESDGDDQ